MAQVERQRESFETRLVRLFMRDVDVVSAAERLGSIDAYLEILDLFYTDGLNRTALLESLSDARDMERYQIEVHGLKSAAANIGAGGLSELARRHERQALDPVWVAENLPALLERYHGLLSEIQRVLKGEGYGRFAPGKSDSSPTLSSEELVSRLTDALNLLEHFRSRDTAEAVEDLLNCALPAQTQLQLERVQELLRLYEDDEAENLLRDLLQTSRPAPPLA